MSTRVRRDYRAEQLMINGAFIQALVENLQAEACNDSCGYVEVVQSKIGTGAERDVYLSTGTQTVKDSSALRNKLGVSTGGDFDVKAQLGEWTGGGDILHIEDGEVEGESQLKPEQWYKVGDNAYIVAFQNMETGAWEIGLTQHFYDDEALGQKYLAAFEQAKSALREAQGMVQEEEDGILAAEAMKRKLARRGMRAIAEEELPHREGRSMVLTTEAEGVEEKKTFGAGGKAS